MPDEGYGNLRMKKTLSNIQTQSNFSVKLTVIVPAGAGLM